MPKSVLSLGQGLLIERKKEKSCDLPLLFSLKSEYEELLPVSIEMDHSSLVYVTHNHHSTNRGIAVFFHFTTGKHLLYDWKRLHHDACFSLDELILLRSFKGNAIPLKHDFEFKKIQSLPIPK